MVKGRKRELLFRLCFRDLHTARDYGRSGKSPSKVVDSLAVKPSRFSRRQFDAGLDSLVIILATGILLFASEAMKALRQRAVSGQNAFPFRGHSVSLHDLQARDQNR